MFPSKVTLVHQLLPADYAYRKAFATRCIDDLSHSQNFFYRFIFSEESIFHLSGITNQQNSRIWSSENPRVYRQHEMNSKKIMVWYAVPANCVLDS